MQTELMESGRHPKKSADHRKRKSHKNDKDVTQENMQAADQTKDQRVEESVDWHEVDTSTSVEDLEINVNRTPDREHLASDGFASPPAASSAEVDDQLDSEEPERPKILRSAGQVTWSLLSRTYSKLGENARSSWNFISKNTREKTKQADQNMKKRPYAYVIGALGVGFALATILV